MWSALTSGMVESHGPTFTGDVVGSFLRSGSKQQMPTVTPIQSQCLLWSKPPLGTTDELCCRVPPVFGAAVAADGAVVAGGRVAGLALTGGAVAGAGVVAWAQASSNAARLANERPSAAPRVMNWRRDTWPCITPSSRRSTSLAVMAVLHRCSSGPTATPLGHRRQAGLVLSN